MMGNDFHTPNGTDPSEETVAFTEHVAELRRMVLSILEASAADGTLRFMDDGVVFFMGGSWNASIWRPNGNLLQIICRQGQGETWRIMVTPFKPEWEARVLDWPSETFDDELRGVIAVLRT